MTVGVRVPLRLADAHGRVATDLRVSLTDRCNLRCTYCMPADGLQWFPTDEVLTDAEVLRVLAIAVRHALDPAALEQARAHTAQLVMPPRALGRLHEIGERLCGIQGTLTPAVRGKAVLVMAGDHGIVAEGISAFPVFVIFLYH